jgi:hypothetical protein
MSTFQILSLLASSATWITALAAFLSLRLVQKQQQAAHRPELTPTSQKIYARLAGDGGGSPLWRETEETEDAKLGVSDLALTGSGGIHGDRYGVRLFNLGNGAAKDISIEWKFAIERLVEQINQMAQRSFADIYFEHERTKQLLSVKEKTGLRATYFLKNDLGARHDYILPCSIENKGHSVGLPHSYITLISAYLYLAFAQKTEAKQFELDDKIGNLTLVAKFTDIAGNRYSKMFEFKFNPVMYSRTEPPSFRSCRPSPGRSPRHRVMAQDARPRPLATRAPFRRHEMLR